MTTAPVIAVTAALALVGFSGNAAASSTADLEKSLRVAANTWHAPELARSQIITTPFVTDLLGDRALGAADLPDQQIWLRPGWEGWDPDYLCTVIVHEQGHLTGHNHSPDPSNVMYPVIGRMYWRCEFAFYPPHKAKPDNAHVRTAH